MVKPAANSVIAASNVSFAFGQGISQQRVLSNVSFKMMEHEIVVVSGPSGSGKTTLLSLIGGLRSLKNGSLVVLEQEANGASHDALLTLRRSIGFVFQGHNLLSFLTVRQNVALALELNKNRQRSDDDLRVAEIIDIVGLSHKRDSFPENLSGGQKQRVAIARAVINRPRLILADEPTASLDSKSAREVVKLLETLAVEHGTAVLLVTHDQKLFEVADRVLRLDDGRLLEEANLCLEH